MASSKWRRGPTCASPGSLPDCAQKRSSWMQCSAGIASSARRCGNICAAGNSSRQHASSQVDPASYGCKLACKLPERLEATAEVRFNADRGYGFITTKGGGKDVFVHVSTLERSGIEGLSEGQTVVLDVVEGRK